MPKILYLDRKPAMAEVAQAKLADFKSVVLEDDASEEVLLAEIRDAKYVVAGARQLLAKHMKEAHELRCVLIPGAGTEHVDVAYASERGIYVANAPGANAIAVAEIAFGLMLAVARSIPQSYVAVRSGKWVDDTIRQRIEGAELTGKVLGLIGLGNVGTRVARIAKGFDMQVLCYTRTPSAKREQEAGVRFVPLSEVMQKADFVVVCAALTPETRGLIGAEQIALMKKDAYLINVARGPIVDYAALYTALKERRIAGAGIDVLEKEPPGPEHPFFGLDNVVVTPHLGSRSKGAIERVSLMVAEEILRVESGQKPLHLVNPK